MTLARALPVIVSAWLVATAQAEGPRVALVYSDYGDFRHRDDYDSRLADMGWPMTKFENTQFADLVSRLGEFDIVLGSALFNYSNTQDFSDSRDGLLRFVGEGGAVILTDCNYAEHVQWLAGMGGGWEASTAGTKAIGTPMGWIDAEHPLFTTPTRIDSIGGTWAHMRTGEAWTALARSEEGGVTAAFRREGRGFLYMTSTWPLLESLLENLWTCLQLARGQVEAALPDLTTLRLGANRFKARVTNLADDTRTIAVEIRDEVAGADAGVTRETAELAAGERATLRLRLNVTDRGEHRLTPAVIVGDSPVLVGGSTTVSIPPLLQVEIIRPSYRGSIYASHVPDEVVLSAQVTPDPGDDLTDFELRARLQPNQRPQIVPVKEPLTELRVRLEGALGEAVEVSIALRRGAERVAAATLRIPVVARVPDQALIDDAGVTCVDGEPFLPIGIYHVGLDDFAKLASMSFNSVVAWGTTADGAEKALDAAQKAGLKVALELSAFLRGEYDPDGLRQVIDRAKDHPALLTWYTVDEPSGKQLEWCQSALEMIAQSEPHHPVYQVSCSPGEFARYATTTEILAVDPYPIPHSSVDMAAGWMKAAQAAVRDGQPVWLIPQCHNPVAYSNPNGGRGPTPEEERCMVYQGLIYGAKGIIYYPWDDGPCGLVHDASLMDAVAEINAELAEIGTELILAERKLIADDDPPGLRAASFVGKKHVYVIATNTGSETVSASLPFPGAINDEVDVLFEDRTVRTEDGMLTDSLKPLAVHVYRMPGL